MTKIRVLVVDDEPAILRFLKPALEANNYLLMSAGTVAESIQRIAADTPDIVVLDLGLPDGDGKDVIRQVRQWSDVPIIVLSARDREAEKIEALDLGSDDFVNKPFGVGELLARMRAALRRNGREARSVIEVGDLVVDESAHSVVRAGHVVELTHREFSLLVMLCRHSGMVLSKVQLLANVWGFEHYDLNVVEVHVSALRKKLEECGPRVIQTVRGVGYALRQPASLPSG